MREKYRVKIARHAETDLAEIWAYVAEDSLDNANQFILKLEERMATLVSSPRRCPLIPENFPNTMKFEITASDVPGRPWLTFKDASYEITREGDHTVITRRTTIVSRLSPAWYWRRLEAIGVHTEHRYLFEAVENKLKAAK